MVAALSSFPVPNASVMNRDRMQADSEKVRTMNKIRTETSLRRTFLKEAAFAATAFFAGSETGGGAEIAPDWKKQIGLALYTVRDLMAADFEGILAKVAQMGYKEIEPANGYNNMPPKAFRSMLDRYGLRMPSTHTNYPDGTGAELERQLEAQQIMGLKYTEITFAASRRTTAGGDRRPPGSLAPGAYYNPATRVVYNSFKELGAFGPYQPSAKLDEVKRRAGELNANGKIAAKFGIKLFVHNHTGEFERLADDDRTTYDVLLAETDPELVTMQLDIGWAYIAGADPTAMFQKNPGRYELWHVKDVFGIKTVDPKLSPNERVSRMAFAPVGAGQIDYKKVFGHASLAGLKHFFVEQDNAASFGDSLAAARVSFESLSRVL
jgi:sugar phosphate isomerase/epimerase